ncbi:MAG: hypothetical protein Q4F21_06485 [Lachnospiraceae bacterium]|nr:hypothetical protein [Lachnospiraceae bacterium]
MKLRICVCLFAILSVVTAALTFRCFSIQQEYAGLNRRYQAALSQNSEQSPQENGKNAESGQTSNEASDKETGAGKEDSSVGDKGQEEKIQASDAFYYVTLNNNEIIAYTGDRRQICMRTEIDAEELAAVLIQELKQGIYLENLPALYEYLENCSS